jgi:hypothetical protein
MPTVEGFWSIPVVKRVFKLPTVCVKCLFLVVINTLRVIYIYIYIYIYTHTHTHTHIYIYRHFLAVPWLRLILTGLWLRKLRFDPRAVHVRFLVGRATVGLICFQALWVLLCQYDCTNAPCLYLNHLPPGVESVVKWNTCSLCMPFPKPLSTLTCCCSFGYVLKCKMEQ